MFHQKYPSIYIYITSAIRTFSAVKYWFDDAASNPVPTPALFLHECTLSTLAAQHWGKCKCYSPHRATPVYDVKSSCGTDRYITLNICFQF